MISASADSLAKDIGIISIVVSELKLGDVERHVPGRNLMECADHATFEDRAEAFDGIGVDRADDILPLLWSTTP
jgi:hypothetical protein